MNQFNVKNYTSSVPPARTAERIETFLAGAGATHISKRYDNGRVTGIDFVIEAQPSLVITKQAEVAQVFMPYLLSGDGEQTFYYAVKERGFAQLAAPKEITE